MKELQFVISEIETPPGRIGSFMEAKLYDKRGFAVMPLATAYIRDLATGPEIEFIFVPDSLRRRGFATKLIQHCFEQWPNLQLTDGVSEAGKALVRLFPPKTDRVDEARGYFAWPFRPNLAAEQDEWDKREQARIKQEDDDLRGNKK